MSDARRPAPLRPLTALTFSPRLVNFLRYPARDLVLLLVTNTSCLPCRGEQQEAGGPGAALFQHCGEGCPKAQAGGGRPAPPRPASAPPRDAALAALLQL